METEKPDPPNRFFSKENTAQIGRLTIPYPFSAVLGLLMIPVLFMAAMVSIPLSTVWRFWTRRREEQLKTKMKAAGRYISWSEAFSLVEQQDGSFIEEYQSLKGPNRLWWAPQNVVDESPYPCCFEEFPFFCEPEPAEFFTWCQSQFINTDSGAAKLVDLPNLDENRRELLERKLAEFRATQRSVCVAPCRKR